MANLPDVFMPPDAQGVQDIYRGILKPGAGGMFQPGAYPMLPPQGMGGNGITAISINPNGTPKNSAQTDPQALASALLYDAQYDPNNPSSPSSAFSGGWGSGALGGGVPHASGTLFAGKDNSQLPGLPITAYGDTEHMTAAEKAIRDQLGSQFIAGTGQPIILGNLNPTAPNPHSRPSFLGPFADIDIDNQPPPFVGIPKPGVDPWQGMRGGGQPVSNEGLVTGLAGIGNPKVYSQNTPIALSAYQQALQNAAQKAGTTPEAIHQQLMAQQTQTKGSGPAGYVQATGQSTAGQSAGQISNAFRDALASSSRQSGSGPGSQ